MQDDRWQFRFDYVTQKRVDVAALLGEIAAQRGGTGRFGAYDPDFPVPLTGVTTTGLVNGASQTGMSLVTDGWPINTMIARASDTIFIPRVSSSYCQMFTLTADATSNGTGQVTFALDAPLRGSPADNAVIGFAPSVYSQFRIECRLTGFEKTSQPGGLLTVSIQGEEVL